MFPGFEQFDKIFSDKQPAKQTPPHPLNSAVTVVNGKPLYTAVTKQNKKQENMYSY